LALLPRTGTRELTADAGKGEQKGLKESKKDKDKKGNTTPTSKK
jgi:hypothetical protein